VSALVLKDYIGGICFHPTTHIIFPGGSVTPGTAGNRRPNVWSIYSAVSAR